jgi:bidirectional [NiFe] hydrogenase diaphorase subunit
MEVTAHSPELLEFRKLIVELLLTERNHVCSVCVSSGRCELQTLAQKPGVSHVTLPYLHIKCTADGSHRRFVADHNRCILCARCLRVCGAGRALTSGTSPTVDAKGVVKMRIARDPRSGFG